MPEPKPRKTAPADYIFTIELMNPETGLYDIKGVTSDEAAIEGILDAAEDEISGVYRIQVFTLGLLSNEGPIQTIVSLEEFMEFQK